MQSDPLKERLAARSCLFVSLSICLTVYLSMELLT